MDNQVDIDIFNSEELKSLMDRQDIALVSDSIESKEELFRQYTKYLMLPRSAKRFSDYYSVKIYGCGVPLMYLQMKEYLRPESPIPVNENVLISEPDLYYNKKAFDRGDTNLCFVIGYSGSGKSVLTREYEGEGIEKVELDEIVCIKDHHTMDELREGGQMLYTFFSGEGKKYYRSRAERDLFEDHGEVFVEFINYAMRYAAEHRDRRFILEGIWTYLFFGDPSLFDDYAVFMKGTSLIKSKLRRFAREAREGAKSTVERILDFGIYATDSMLHDSNVDKWRRHFEKMSETELRLEDNKYTRIRQQIMNRINDINDRFVHGDREGIEEIMEQTASDPDMIV
ncbi:MAG: hypothetical protein IKE53_02100, partial [Clostridiales bacterium]|nr:hypothetical protein [Clostridiales bacterium]